MLFDLVAAAGQWLRDSFPHISDDPTIALETSVLGAWYLHPEQHVWEILGLNIALIALVISLAKKPWTVQVPHVPRVITWLDVATSLLCVLLVVVIITYKLLTDRTIYMFQPCHLLLYCLVYLAVSTGGGPPAIAGIDAPSFVFNFYLHSMYGAWLALVMPGEGTGLGQCAYVCVCVSAR